MIVFSIIDNAVQNDVREHNKSPVNNSLKCEQTLNNDNDGKGSIFVVFQKNIHVEVVFTESS